MGRKLDAQHHIIIDQLEFGDKTASKQAVSLPIKLAVALLKDRHGRHRSESAGGRLARRSQFPLGADHLEGLRQHYWKRR